MASRYNKALNVNEWTNHYNNSHCPFGMQVGAFTKIDITRTKLANRLTGRNPKCND